MNLLKIEIEKIISEEKINDKEIMVKGEVKINDS